MKTSVFAFLGIALGLILSTTAVAETAPATSLQVMDAAICRDVINRECHEGGNTFKASVEKLYCLTRIVGAANPAQVTHVWYLGETERARVTLDVRSPNWRTYSSKTILQRDVGSWRVDVLGPEGNLLKTVQFEVTP